MKSKTLNSTIEIYFYKRPWWESLPSNKNQKNKVILDEYDKIKSSAPKWPWMTALKALYILGQ